MITKPEFPYTLGVSRVRKVDEPSQLGTVAWWNHRTNGAVVAWDSGQRGEHELTEIQAA